VSAGSADRPSSGGRREGETGKPAEERLTALKARAALTAIVAVAAGAAGIKLVTAFSTRVVTWVLGLVEHAPDLPIVHVPADLSALSAPWIVPAAFLTLCATTIFGFSAGLFGRRPLLLAAVPVIALGVVSFTYEPATSQWLNLVPSKLERDIVLGNYDNATNILTQEGVNPLLGNYVRAQIALRTHDTAALRGYGEPVLLAADQWAYRSMSDASAGRRNVATEFEPEVIEAIDVALNGEPLSQVGIQRAREHVQTGALGARLVEAGLFGLGLLLTLTGFVLFVVWNGMRQRIGSIQSELRHAKRVAAGEDDDAASDRHAGGTAAAGAGRIGAAPMTPAARRAAARAAAGKPPQQTLTIWWAVGLMAAGVALGWWMSRPAQPVAYLPQAATYMAPAEAHPCRYVGEWFATRQNVTYRVIMSEDGHYIGRALMGDAVNTARSISGTWEVHPNRTMVMTGGWLVRPMFGSEEIPINDISTNSFNLVESGSSLITYTLARSTPTRNCPAVVYNPDAPGASPGRGSQPIPQPTFNNPRSSQTLTQPVVSAIVTRVPAPAAAPSEAAPNADTDTIASIPLSRAAQRRRDALARRTALVAANNAAAAKVASDNAAAGEENLVYALSNCAQNIVSAVDAKSGKQQKPGDPVDCAPNTSILAVATDRLQQALKRVKAGSGLSDPERSQIYKDFTAVSKLQDQPGRKAYLDMAADLFDRLDASGKRPSG
jgi:hypothetical protein